MERVRENRTYVHVHTAHNKQGVCTSYVHSLIMHTWGQIHEYVLIIKGLKNPIN